MLILDTLCRIKPLLLPDLRRNEMPYKCTNCGRIHKTGELCDLKREFTKDEAKEFLHTELSKCGVKYDDGKPRWALMPAYSLEEVAKVYTFGATKYADNNWRKGMLWSRTFSAIMRHAWAFWRGETLDPETGLHHMAHCAFGCLTLIEYTRKKTPTDDRPFRMILRKGSK